MHACNLNRHSAHEVHVALGLAVVEIIIYFRGLGWGWGGGKILRSGSALEKWKTKVGPTKSNEPHNIMIKGEHVLWRLENYYD